MESGSEDFDVGGISSELEGEELASYTVTATGWTIDPGPHFIQGYVAMIAPQASGLTWSSSDIWQMAIAVEGTPVASDDEE